LAKAAKKGSALGNSAYVSPNCPLTDLSALTTASPAGMASGVSEVEQVAISVV
jgi:hypothetical protein